jgi:hypothetical protein
MVKSHIIWGDEVNYFTIKNASSVTPKWTVAGDPLEYKLSGGVWSTAVSGTSISVPVNNEIKFRGSDRTRLFSSAIINNAWVINGSDVIINGNILTLLNYRNIKNLNVSNNGFSYMFFGCNSIVNCDIILPSLSLGGYAYSYMFRGCSNLLNAPVLPALSLGVSCYAYMFYECTSLTVAPVLPATSLTEACYQNMFNGCTSLINVPELPATIISISCYEQMFSNCSSLINPPSILPAMSVYDNCYGSMFAGCSSLISAPELPATSLATQCYLAMFGNCTSLLEAPELPATTLVDYCYFGMFMGCNNLLDAPGNDRYTNYSPAQTNMFSNAINIETPLQYCAIPATWGGSGTCPDYFTITNCTNVIPKWTTPGDPLEYKLGGSDVWIAATSGSSISTGGSVIKFRGRGRDSLFNSDNGDNMWVYAGSDIIASGNINTLLDYNKKVKVLGDFAFSYLFYECHELIEAPYLPATSLSNMSYGWMFRYCNKLVEAPTLPADTLGIYCYTGMFEGCTSLVDAPALSASNLVSDCYHRMFMDCTSLVNVPDVDIYTTYTPTQGSMFEGASKIENPIPWCEIPSSFGGRDGNCPDYFTITNSTSVTPSWSTTGYPLQYKLDTADWTDATNAVAIPTEGYTIKFRGLGRIGLFNSDNLSNTWIITGTNVIINGNMQTLLDYQTPPESIGPYGFDAMFRGQTSITHFIGTLPATVLSSICYYNMFTNCSNMITGPSVLPSTSLKSQCYDGMFAGCASLLVAPELPATSLANNCYRALFSGCVSLREAPGADRYTTYSGWSNVFNNCSSLAIPLFWCEIPTSWGGGGGSCPFIIKNASTVTPRWRVGGDPLQYSLDNGNTWANAESGTSISTGGVDIRFRGTGRTALFNINGLSGTNRWIIDGSDIKLSGDINTLLDYENPVNSLGNYAFSGMFYGCENIISADIILPASDVGTYCYALLFYGCTSLVNVPALSATTLGNYCYNQMFFNCNSLVNAPALPATTLATSCYSLMFGSCTSLVNAPALPAETLAQSCYTSMFSDCISLTTAPELPATTLVNTCYRQMFNGCTSLTAAPSLNAATLISNCYYQMFMDCTSLTAAPALNAATLVAYCYQGMFSGCINLVNAPGNDVYTAKSPAQASMFADCVNVETSIPYCQIPTNFGGAGGTCPYFTLTNTTSVTPKWTIPGDPLEYKLGDADWTDATSGDSIITNDVIRFRGIGRDSLFTSDSMSNAWVISGSDVIASGNINTLVDYRRNMFTLGSYAFSYLFYGCTDLTVAPDLPAISLGTSCYSDMFNGCTGLVSAPVLIASNLVDDCYNGMFRDCTGLVSAPGVITYTTYTPVQADMFAGAFNIEDPITWCSIPTPFGGGSDFQDCYSLRFTNTSSVKPVWTNNTETTAPLEYSLDDGVSWSNAVSGSIITTGVPVRFRGSGRTRLFTSKATTNAWIITGSNVIIDGAFNALLDYSSQLTTIGTYAFNSMLSDCTSLVTVNASFKAKVIGNYCYENMFYGCSNLVNGPSVLPNSSAGNATCRYMFANCISLIKAPLLLSKTNARYSCQYMFYGCSSLTDAPWLPVVSLSGVYDYMFANCTGLVNAPNSDVYTLSATTQVSMFENCINLQTPLTYAQIPSGWK